MKNYYLAILLVVLIALVNCNASFSQSTGQNYVSSRTLKEKGITDVNRITGENSHQSIQYYDGMGRPVQMVQRQYSPDQKDFVGFREYDGFGREPLVYTPFADANDGDGSYKTDPAVRHEYFYDNALRVAHTDHSFTPVEFESSPLGRIIKQGAPGLPWQFKEQDEHVITFDYRTNISAEVRLWTWDPVTKTVQSNSYYDEGKLSVIETGDENNHTTYKYKDFLDRVILKKSSYNNTYFYTYYVYDDFGNMVCVIAPKAYSSMQSTGVYNTFFQ